MNTFDSSEENELAERFNRLGDATTFDPDALQHIVDAAKEPTFSSRRWALVAAAAGTVVVAGVAATLIIDQEEPERLGTYGQNDDADEPTETTTSTAPTTTSTVPTTEAPAVTTTPTTDLSAHGLPLTEESEPTLPRAPALLTLQSSDYAVEILYAPSISPGYAPAEMLWSRDVNGLASETLYNNQPDFYGRVGAFSWSGSNGPRCLQSAESVMNVPGFPTHSFNMGFVGAEISRIELVMVDGTRVPVTLITTDAVQNGMRAWLVEHPNGRVQRVEGYDASGTVVSQITLESGIPPHFGHSLDGTCT